MFIYQLIKKNAYNAHTCTVEPSLMAISPEWPLF